MYFAARYERLRAATAAAVPGWLEALGRIEAAGALAGFAWLHPEYVFPETHDKPELVARALGHPLIPQARRITNDFRLDGLGSVALLTGSNMSGKSTFLRTIGVNVCLALAGAPVCAERLTAPRVRLFCSVRIEDRLEEGLSYFYAEVKRLRQILDATADRQASPVLFLIDEIFKGTNNRERVIGSRHLLAALTEGNGFGLVTTHDLELTALAESNRNITNDHFQETVQDGRLSFDYKLRPGPCPTTNALRIMALEGLPVPKPEP
jgi:DNA mismatch repair ATPase MutS